MSVPFCRYLFTCLCILILASLSTNTVAGPLDNTAAPEDFWATWCPPCRRSFPWMEEMHTRYHKDGLTIVAISVDAKYELAEKFVQELNPSFISAHDPGKKTAKLYKLRAMPSSYLIDRSGNIIRTHLGFRTSRAKKVEAEIKAALKQ